MAKTMLALLGPKSPHYDFGRGVVHQATGGLDFAGLGAGLDKAKALASQPLWQLLGYPSEDDWIAVGKPTTPYKPPAMLPEPAGPPVPGASGITAGAVAAPVSAPPIAINKTFIPNLPEGIGHNLTSAAYSPDLSPEMLKLQSERQAAKIGVPQSVFDIAPTNRSAAPAGDIGAYNPSNNQVSLNPSWIANGKVQQLDVPLHEALHSLEFNLTPQERDQLNQLIAANPPAPGGHHPVSTAPGTASGITDYFDQLYASGGAVPPSIMQFINAKAPEVAKRIAASTPASGITAGASAAPASSVTLAQSAPAPAANATAGFTGPGEAYTPPPSETLLQRYGDLLGVHHPAQPPRIIPETPGVVNQAANYVSNNVPVVGPALGSGIRAAGNPVNLGLMGAGAPLELGLKPVLGALGREAAANFLMGSSGAASSEGAKALGAPPIVQTGAGLAGGFLPGLAKGGIKGVVSNITKGGGEEAGQAAKVLTEEQFLAQHGAPFMGGDEPALHKAPGGIPKNSKAVQRVQDAMAANNEQRAALRLEYARKVAAGEIRPPTTLEQLITTANGHPDNAATQAAQRVLQNRGIDWGPPNAPPATDIPGLAESAAMTPEELKATTAASSAATRKTGTQLKAEAQSLGLSTVDKNGKALSNAKLIDSIDRYKLGQTASQNAQEAAHGARPVAELPAQAPEGTVRMYRGQAPYEAGKAPLVDSATLTQAPGRWFTPNLRAAQNYAAQRGGSVVAIDVPREDLVSGKWAAGTESTVGPRAIAAGDMPNGYYLAPPELAQTPTGPTTTMLTEMGHPPGATPTLPSTAAPPENVLPMTPRTPQDYIDTPNADRALTPTRPPELDNRVPLWARATSVPEETAASSTATAAPGYQSIDEALTARNAARERILSGGGGDNVPPSNTASAAAPAPNPDNLETTGSLASQLRNEAKGVIGAAVSVKSSLSPPILRQGMTRLVTNPVEAMREGWSSIRTSLSEADSAALNDTIANSDWVRATQGGENTANLAAERFAKGLGVAPEGASVVPNAGFTYQDVGGTLLDWRGAQDLMRQSQEDLVNLAAKNSIKLPEGASKSTIARILSNELKPEELQGLNNSRIGSIVQNFAPIKLSDRQMALQLNLNRTNWYTEVASKMWQAGNRNVDDYTELRKAIENFTQRGSWGQGSVPFFFSTRALSGRVQTVGRMLDVLVHPTDAFQPGARQEAAKVLLGMTGASMAFIGGAAVAAKQLGMPASVNWSSGLPTLQIGNSHYDPWAGWNSLAKLVVGVGQDINKEFQNSKTNGWADLPQNAFSDLFNRSLEFGRKGLSPLVGLAVDTGTKKTYYGAKFNLAKEISSGNIVSDLIAPFILQDLYDAYRYDGLRGVSLNTVPSFLSAGVNAYPPQGSNNSAVQNWLKGVGQGGSGNSQVQNWLNGGQ